MGIGLLRNNPDLFEKTWKEKVMEGVNSMENKQILWLVRRIVKQQNGRSRKKEAQEKINKFDRPEIDIGR